MPLPPDRREPVPTAPAGAAPSYAGMQVLDLHVLLNAAAGDRALAWELMTLFTETAPQMCARLTTAMQSGECAASLHESHALAGAAGLIGATGLSAILKQIEGLAFQRQAQSFASLLPTLSHTFATVMAAVAQVLQDFDPPAGMV